MKKCQKCGEASEDQFDSCWKCGAPFDAITASVAYEQGITVPEEKPEARPSGPFWFFAMLAFAFPAFVLAAVLFSGPNAGQDFSGLAGVVWSGLFLLGGCVLSVVFSIISAFRAEARCGLGLIFGSLSLLFLFYVVGKFSSR
jgi:hypothetical protein